MQPMFVSVRSLGKGAVTGDFLVYPCTERKGRVCKEFQTIQEGYILFTTDAINSSINSMGS